MAQTVNRFTGDGTTVLYDVNFPLGFIDISHVYVYLEGDEYTDQIEYTWRSSTQIELVNASTVSGREFNIRRIVPRSELTNSYTTTFLNPEELNESFKQSLMVLEEIQDGYADVDGKFFIGNGLYIENNNIYGIEMEETPNSTDVATVGYVLEQTGELSDILREEAIAEFKADGEAAITEWEDTANGKLETWQSTVDTLVDDTETQVDNAINDLSAKLLILELTGTWQPSTAYYQDQAFQDPTDLSWYKVLTSYSSDASDITVDINSGNVVLYQGIISNYSYLFVDQVLRHKFDLGTAFDDVDVFDILMGLVVEGTATTAQENAINKVNNQLGIIIGSYT